MGIGTAVPASKLEVAGNVSITTGNMSINSGLIFGGNNASLKVSTDVVLKTAALDRLSCMLFNSVTRDWGTSFDALRKRASNCLFVF